MLRRDFLGSAGAAAGAAPASCPNILHIQSDQQQWATIAGRSLCRTPNIDRLASEGMLFERAYTPSAICCPSRAFLSTPSVKRDLDPGVVLHSQRLKQAGYRLGYVGKWHCSYLRTPADFGFDDLANVFGCSP